MTENLYKQSKYLLIALVCFYLCFSVVPPVTSSEAEPDWRFGLIETYESPAAAGDAGAAWTRVTFHWAITQADGPASWTPRVSDEQIDGEIAAGRLVAGLLIGIPDWARDTNSLPVGLWLSPDDSGNTWANFVREAVGRYAGRINHWIIWNEPDVWDVNAPGHTWDGSVQDFFQLHRTAYQIAKAANPNARIHLAAMTYFWDAQFGREQYLDHLLAVIAADPAAAGHDYYFDYLTAHLYFQPDRIYDVIQEFHAIRHSYGLPWKPIWLVETNAPPIDDPTWPVSDWTLSVTQYEQAAFIPQAMAAALAAGAERIAVYKLKDTPGDLAANPEPFGLIRRNGARRPAFTTYQVAVESMAGVQGARRERWDEVGQIRLYQGSQTTTVMFARLPAPQQAEVRATDDTAVLVDMWGTRQNVTADGGVFTIDLPGALCTQSIGDYCMIGGTTYYLVQAINNENEDLLGDPFGFDMSFLESLETGETAGQATTAAGESLTTTATPVTTQIPVLEPTPTIAGTLPTDTPPPLVAATGAAATAQLMPAMTAEPTPLAAAAEPARPAGLSHWFLGIAFLLALALICWWLIQRWPLSQS